MRKYYTLLLWDLDFARYCIEFGDYDRRVVKEEMQDYHDSYRSIPYKLMRIIETYSDQASIDAEVKRLNDDPSEWPNVSPAL